MVAIIFGKYVACNFALKVGENVGNHIQDPHGVTTQNTKINIFITVRICVSDKILMRLEGLSLCVLEARELNLSTLKNTENIAVRNKCSIGSAQVVLQLLFIADVGRRRVHLPEHDRSKPGRQVVTFLLICNVTMWVIYTFEAQKVIANPVQVCGKFILKLCYFWILLVNSTFS